MIEKQTRDSYNGRSECALQSHMTLNVSTIINKHYTITYITILQCRDVVSVSSSWSRDRLEMHFLNVSVSGKCGNISVSSLIESQTSQFRLRPQCLVYIPVATYSCVTNTVKYSAADLWQFHSAAEVVSMQHTLKSWTVQQLSGCRPQTELYTEQTWDNVTALRVHLKATVSHRTKPTTIADEWQSKR